MPNHLGFGLNQLGIEVRFSASLPPHNEHSSHEIHHHYRLNGSNLLRQKRQLLRYVEEGYQLNLNDLHHLQTTMVTNRSKVKQSNFPAKAGSMINLIK